MAIMTDQQFIFAVILMYGFFAVIFSISNGAVAGLPSTAIGFDAPPEPSGDPITNFFTSADYLITSVFTFFAVLLITPFTSASFWWIAPINWAIFGTTIYLLIKMIRGN